MSATSNSFWSATEGIRDELQAIAELGADLYGTLEANDDPEEVAEGLLKIHERLINVSGRVAQSIPAMQEIGKAFDKMAAVKS